MNTVTIEDLASLHFPVRDSHKGQNGRLLLIGGSSLFHAASLWSLTVASRVVDLVHFSSVEENNDIVRQAKNEFRNGIVISRGDIESYIQEDDCILIGPGMMRTEHSSVVGSSFMVHSLQDIEQIENEGEKTRELTNYLLKKYPQKQWVIDAGALQMMDLNLIPPGAILTPHKGEFEGVWGKHMSVGASAKQSVGVSERQDGNASELQGVGASGKQMTDEERVILFAKQYQCIVLLKGEKDIVSNGSETRIVEGGNAGMTKGGTGDVLAGLIAALACTNDPFISTIAGSYINKKAGDSLYETVGPFFNASDLADQIPRIMRDILLM